MLEHTEQGLDVILFDNDLTPAQTRNLEKALGIKVLDRTELILDIFGRRARTKQARAQVAALVGCLPSQVVFTGSATEAAALALHVARPGRGEGLVHVQLDHLRACGTGRLHRSVGGA